MPLGSELLLGLTTIVIQLVRTGRTTADSPHSDLESITELSHHKQSCIMIEYIDEQCIFSLCYGIFSLSHWHSTRLRACEQTAMR